jgi:hypothetical protein
VRRRRRQPTWPRWPCASLLFSTFRYCICVCVCVCMCVCARASECTCEHGPKAPHTQPLTDLSLYLSVSFSLIVCLYIQLKFFQVYNAYADDFALAMDTLRHSLGGSSRLRKFVNVCTDRHTERECVYARASVRVYARVCLCVCGCARVHGCVCLCASEPVYLSFSPSLCLCGARCAHLTGRTWPFSFLGSAV